jgi:hypothetical protein
MRPLSAPERRRTLEQAATDLAAALATLDASVGLLVDSQNGHPRAARYDRNGGRSGALWCWEHERDHSECEREAAACGGAPIVATSDPTGDAATRPDPAARTLHNIDQRALTIATAAQTLAAELARWAPPSSEMQRPDPGSATAPDGWCTSCWLADQAHVPISRRPDGTPYYAGLCRFCGTFKAEHGRIPPAPVLRERHAGKRITQTLIDKHLHPIAINRRRSA